MMKKMNRTEGKRKKEIKRKGIKRRKKEVGGRRK